MPYPSSIATLAQARRRRGLGDTTGAAVGTALLGPGVGTAIGGALLNPASWFGSGPAPLRAGHRALIQFFGAAGDVPALQHILTATFTGSTQKLYPTAAQQYASSVLAAIDTTAPANIAVLQQLAAAWNSLGDKGTGAPYDAWERQQVQADLARAAITSGPPLVTPNVTDVLSSTVIAGLNAITGGTNRSGTIPAVGANGVAAPATAGVNMTLLLGGGLLVGLLLMKKGRR